MTQWVLIVLMSSMGGGGLNQWRQPAIQMQGFNDRPACEAAAEVVRKMASSREARLEFTAVNATCVPAGSEPAK
jgi:hypothetical protein